MCNNIKFFLTSWSTALHLSSLIQLSNLSENEDVLLELFVSLPQLKQVTSDKEELVTNIVEMASKFNFCHWTEGLDRGLMLAELYNDYCMFVINRKKPSDGATAGWKKTRDALQGEILRLISCCVSLLIQILDKF